jgi:hypothetical protein
MCWESCSFYNEVIPTFLQMLVRLKSTVLAWWFDKHCLRMTSPPCIYFDSFSLLFFSQCSFYYIWLCARYFIYIFSFHFYQGRTASIDVDLSAAIVISGLSLDAVQSFLALLQIISCHKTTIYRKVLVKAVIEYF